MKTSGTQSNVVAQVGSKLPALDLFDVNVELILDEFRWRRAPDAKNCHAGRVIRRSPCHPG
jgi:hypothetical protein